ncbi:MAG: IS91 family transposase, partial [Sphingopyxis sp.]
PPPTEEATDEPQPQPTCPCCGGTMIIIEVFERRYQPRAPPQLAVSSGTPAP